MCTLKGQYATLISGVTSSWSCRLAALLSLTRQRRSVMQYSSAFASGPAAATTSAVGGSSVPIVGQIGTEA